MADDIILDVKNLNTSFFVDGKEVHIIKNVSLQAKRGKTLALVGESGCGKSVTMHSIVRMMPKNARVKSDYVLYRSLKGNIKKEYRLDLMSNYGKDMRRLRGTEISMIFRDYTYHIHERNESYREVFNDALARYFLDIVWKYTESFRR